MSPWVHASPSSKWWCCSTYSQPSDREVSRAGVTIITGDGGPGFTDPTCAGVALRAGVAVLTGSSGGAGDAAAELVAAVVGAAVAVVAADRPGAGAGARLAGVTCGAGVTVIARQAFYGLRRAPLGRVADVEGAWIPVVTLDWLPWDASAALAGVARRADVAIRASAGGGGEDAPLGFVAAVGGARVAVVANRGACGCLAPCRHLPPCIGCRRRGQTNLNGLTARQRVAHVKGAGVAVVALDRGTRRAAAVLTRVRLGALVAVLAPRC